MSTRRSSLGLLLSACLAACSAAPPAPSLPEPTWQRAAPAVRAQLDAAYARLKAAPRDAEAWGNFALMLHSYGTLDLAERSYARAAELAPGEARWLYLHGTALEESGYSDLAAVELRRAISLDPRAIPPRLRLADALAQIGNAYGSRVVYEQVLRSDARNAPARYGLGTLLLDGGDAAGAIPQLVAALEYGGDFGAGHAALARAYAAVGDVTRASWERAAAKGRENARLSPDPELQHQLDTLVESDRQYIVEGMKLAYAGRVDDAIRAYEAALARVPNNSDAHVTLIGLYGAKHDLARAEQHFRTAITLDAESAKAWFNIGYARLESGSTEEAIAALERAIELAPGDAEARAVLGQGYERSGRSDEALAQYRQALEVDPDHAHSRYLLVHALIAARRYPEAFAAGTTLGNGSPRWSTAILRALAGVHAQRGEMDQAFALLDRASTVAGNDPALIAAVNADLHRYRAQAGAE
jgi:tetratricopeptide (TPR) repeat protein